MDPTVQSSDTSRDEATVAEAVRSRVNGFMTNMGVAQAMRQDRVATKWTEVYSHVKARTTEQKEEVRDAIMYLFIVHGTSPEIDWSEVELNVSYFRGPMTYIVDNLLGRHQLRKFAAPMGEKAVAWVTASPQLRDTLKERAIRSGLSPGQEHLIIDFVGRDGTLDTAQLAARIGSKATSVQRGELRHDNHMTRHNQAVADMATTASGKYGPSGDMGM